MLTIPPSVCFLSAWRQMAENLMAVAYENGVNLFDTAEVYASGRCGSAQEVKCCQCFL